MERGACFQRAGKVKDVFVLALGEIGRGVYQFVTDCLEETLLRRVDQGVPEQREEIVSHHDEIAAGLGCPEVVGDKTVDREVRLQFLDAVFGVGPSTVGVVHHLHGKVKVCHKAAVSVLAIVGLVFEKA